MGRGASTRRIVPSSAVALTLLALLGGASTGPAEARVEASTAVPRPNIVVVMTDDMRADDLEAMPATRRLIGAQGMTFTNSIVTFPLCCPSRAPFLTGLYPHNHGVRDNHAPEGGYASLDGSETLAVWLQRAGYATVMMGKYLNDYGLANPTEVPPGWTEWHGAIKLPYYGGLLNENGLVVRLGRLVPQDYATHVYRDRALEIVRRRAPSSQPFFLWLSFYAPHAGQPAEADDPPDYGTPAVAEAARDRFASHPPRRLPSFNAPTPVRLRELLPPEKVVQIDEHYRQRLEALVSVDKAVAQLVSELARSGELANTVIVFTSDNGFFLGEHRIPTGKIWFYDEALHVPLLMRGPGIPAGVQATQLVANLDLAPTLLELAQATAPEGWAFDGRSLSELIRNPAAIWNRRYLIESPPTKTGEPSFWGVRTTQFLHVQYPGTSDGELYDLSVDPYELQTLWSDKRYAQTKQALARTLEALKTCVGLACRRA